MSAAEERPAGFQEDGADKTTKNCIYDIKTKSPESSLAPFVDTMVRNGLAKPRRKIQGHGQCKKSTFAKGTCYYDNYDEQSSLFSSASSINKKNVEIALDEQKEH